LGVNWKSAIKNIVAGENNSLIFQSLGNYLKGKARLFGSPKKAYKIISDSGFLNGSYIDVVEIHAVKGKIKKVIDTIAFGGMEFGEYEIRGSFLLGEMTDLEWKHGELGVTGVTVDGNAIIDEGLAIKRFRSILDNIAKTQGVYSRVDSPLALQTTIGRSVFQFGRWKITNVQLVRNLVAQSVKDIRAGDVNSKNTRSLLKMVILIAFWTFVAWKLAQAGYKTASKMAKAGTELINLFLNPFEELKTLLTENPLMGKLSEIAFSHAELISLISGGDKPSAISFNSGIESTFLAGLETLKDIGIV
jgi:hypothetical protein